MSDLSTATTFWDREIAAPTYRSWLEQLIERERNKLVAGAAPYYAIVVARPRRGVARLLASWLYFLEPKIKRVRYEIRTRLT